MSPVVSRRFMRWYASISSAVTSSDCAELYLRLRSSSSTSLTPRFCLSMAAFTLASSSFCSCRSSPSPNIAFCGATLDVPSPASADVPALVKAFLEQVARPGFALRYRDKGLPEKLLAGRSARIVVTMGMPSLFYRLFYFAHSLKSLKRNIFRFVGFAPVRDTIIGAVESDPKARQKHLSAMQRLGRSAH